jgi:hypothetical protein
MDPRRLTFREKDDMGKPNQSSERRSAGPRVRGLAVLVGVLGFAVTATGCDTILDVDVPGQVIASDLTDPIRASLLVASAVADFECAFGGYVVAAGLLGDEFADAQNFAGYYDIDRRQVGPEGGPLATTTCTASNSAPGIYTSVSTARYQGDNAARLLEGWTDAQVANRQSLLATSYAYAAYSIVLLGESYCTIAIDLSPELQPSQIFAEAETRFTKALAAAQSAGNQAIRNFALVGRARARLNLAKLRGSTTVNTAKLTEAAADARQVPAGFVQLASFGATPIRRNNNVFNGNNFSQTVTVEDDFRTLTDGGVPDPRVRVVNAGVLAAGDRATPLWTQTKYAALGTGIPIARHAEAQLISAEADLEAGNLSGAIGVIDALHAAVGLPPFGGTSAAQVREHLLGSAQSPISERQRELFLEGQHLGDKLRYGLPFTPVAGTSYPVPKGGTYGGTTCIPLPLKERQNNPNI